MTPIEMDPGKGLNGAIAGQLRAERSRARVTFDELHERTDVSRRTLIRLLNGERQISMAALESICEALGLSPSDVIASAQRHLEQEARAVLRLAPHTMSDEGHMVAASDHDYDAEIEAMQEDP